MKELRNGIGLVVIGWATLACEPPLPTASLQVSPDRGTAPLTVTLDARESTGEGALQYRFDWDGDGTLDTDPTADPVYRHVYPLGGRFLPRVEVTDALGRSTMAVADVEVAIEAAFANISVDTNRDGLIDAGDEPESSTWTATRGATFIANFDDDDRDGRRDFRDAIVNGDGDVDDLSPILIRRSPQLVAGDQVSLRVQPAIAAAKVRIFARDDNGAFYVVHDLAQTIVDIDAETLARTDLEWWLEGAGSRDYDWDGRVTLRLTVSRAGAELGVDEVMLRAAPILFPDNTRPAEQLYVMRIAAANLGPNLPFYNALEALRPPGVDLYTVDAQAYYGDRWVQDNMQTGYQVVPSSEGPRYMLTYLETERFSGYGLENLVPFELMRADFGFAYPGGGESSHNYGGNLEVMPPHAGLEQDYPFGRFFIGGGDQGLLNGRRNEDHMAAEQRGFLDAQETQGTAVELSSEWLAVGHIDEVILAIPDASRASRPWRIAIASPTLARQALNELADRGDGGLAVFAGRETETTVAAILGDEDLMALNDAAQARIDSIRMMLIDEMALTQDDFIELPVLYEPVPYGGLEFVAALNPGVQNLVVLNQTLFVPDPEGPRSGGIDVWQQQIVDALANTGNQVEFVDVFESYHLLLGEAHCGTNVRHTPYEKLWWNP